MKPEEYAAYDALDLKMLLDNGEISALELHEVAMAAIEALNPKLNFLTSFSPEEAERALAQINAQAAFAGIPFLVKGGVGMSGQPAVPSCRLGDGLICQEDSELVRRLKRTGVVTLGSTNIPELCNSFTTESISSGPCRNPWNIEHSSGGSSGGSSAAVAAGIVPMAQSGDGAGSIRVPAHFCGVFGLAASRGRNPIGPYGHPDIFGLLRKHVTTRSVRDSAAMLDQLHGPEIGAFHQSRPPQRPFLEEVSADPGNLRIAFSTASPSGHPLHPECATAVSNAAHLCEALGHNVEETAFVYDWDIFLKGFYDYWAFGLGGGVKGLEQVSGKKAGPDNLERSAFLMFEHFKGLTSERINQVIAELYAINERVGRFFEQWDVLITPVALTPTPKLGLFNDTAEGFYSIEQMLSEQAPFTAIFNVSGQPSMSVPLYQSAEGLPIGVLCTAPIGNEAALIRLAAQFEQACPWIQRRPPVSLYV
ncbi:amidase [Paremcibacter congregatus]|uniref:Amidase n=1 Tax=Paremcibacter congregatus TaxID=2043170 RepID=A0A2G4YT12_9PROT|nr:amidase [Paremcibacter congregatus]PHZ85482.1 amidase [Paremcibacter congregatus]QDE28032.1 amidase [Paremcibacter congregatus]